MNDEWNGDELKFELERKNFVRAVQIAVSIGSATNNVKDIQLEAIGQMALNRNATVTKSLAQEYGISKQKLKQYLEQWANKLRKSGDIKALKACYDTTTGKYFTFEEWINFHI